ncbi:M91 family zinc metallopeptidase [Paraburkholderia azotifigens]|nr:M91 family zinc metallopeptidase [Paraburkholderia azotifigens]
MSSQIRRSGSTPSDHAISAPSTSSAGQATNPATSPAANPASPAKARLPAGKLSALSSFSKTMKEKTSRPVIPPTGEMVTTTTKWNGVVIRTRPGDSKAFPRQVNAALDEIASKPAGKQLLQEIENHQGNDQFGYKVAIMPQASGKRQTLFGRPRTYADGNVTRSASDEKASTPGEGAASSIKWNPQQTVTPDGTRPPFIGLAHEMIHAHNNLKGESSLISKPSGSTDGMGAQGPGEIAQKKTSRPVNPKVEDENKVVGLGKYADSAAYPLTENTIRKEHGLAPRQEYSGLDE